MSVTALVLGSNGFCGKALVDLLLKRPGSTVVGADMQETNISAVDHYHSVDIADRDHVSRIVKQTSPDWIFNLAGVATGDLERQISVNLIGAVSLLDAVRDQSPHSRVILAGSAAEYGLVPETDNPIDETYPCKPVGAYGISKHSMTLAALGQAQKDGTEVLVLRPFNIVGPGVPTHLVLGAVMNRALIALSTKGDAVVKVGNLDAQRDFVSVDDVARSYLLAAESDVSGEVINICSGQPTSVREIVERVLSFAPRSIRLEMDPSLIKAVDVRVSYGNPKKAKRLLEFESSSLSRSIEMMWKANESILS